MTKRKLSDKQIKNIQKLLQEGHKPKELAKKYGVHISVIYRRAKYAYQSRGLPVDIKNKVVKAIENTTYYREWLKTAKVLNYIFAYFQCTHLIFTT